MTDDDPPERDASVGDEPSDAAAIPNAPGDAPTVTCSRCGQSWDLDYELDELQVGNRALERFALDHRRHTGHYPDDVTPWVGDCRICPDEELFLAEDPARRWAETHVRHTRHTVDLDPPGDEPAELVEPG